MQNNLLIASNDKDIAQVSMGVRTAQALRERSYVNTYEWIPEKEGLFATLFPSDATYHPLYAHDYKEIAQNLFGIETLKVSPEDKKNYVAKAKDIVIGSYARGSMAGFYIALIIIAVVIMIKYYYQATLVNALTGASTSSTVNGVTTTGTVSASDASEKLDTIFKWVFIILGSYAAYCVIDAKVWAEGRGVAYWQAFNTDFTQRLDNGELPEKIMTDYGNQLEKEKDRAAMTQFHSNTGNVTTGQNSFLGAALGGLIGGLVSGQRR